MGELIDLNACGAQTAGILHEAVCCIQQRAVFLSRPSIMLGLVPFRDGDAWCALYGDNLQDGIAGFGVSPDAACAAFDQAWYEKIADPGLTG
jgi:hypothetical protein